MMTIFFVPIVVVAFFESNLDTSKNRFMKVWFSAADEGEEDDPNNQDPDVSDTDGNLKICKVKFEDLIATFPDATVVSELPLVVYPTHSNELEPRVERQIWFLRSS